VGVLSPKGQSPTGQDQDDIILYSVESSGLLWGLTASLLISHFAQCSTRVSPTSILVAFMLSALAGVLVEFSSARKAAFLDPIDTHRYE
jgi:ABC-type antimicrobial peptide transport system permease subunit